MNKTLTYSGFTISALVVILVFLTAKTYTQLVIAVILYPLLAYFALKVLPRRSGDAPAITIKLPARPVRKVEQVNQGKVVADIDKRTFIKLIGATGISFFLFSLFGRRAESLLFGQNISNFGSTPAEPAQSTQSMQGYKITEIDDGLVSYYGFTTVSGGWMIMREDTETSSFRYAKGNSGFSNNWRGRENLKYDYFFNLN